MRLSRNRLIVSFLALTLVCATTTTAQAGVFPWLWNVFFGPANAPLFPRMAARRAAFMNPGCCDNGFAPPAPGFAPNAFSPVGFSPATANFAPSVNSFPAISYAPPPISYAPAATVNYAPPVSYSPVVNYASGCCGGTTSAPVTYSDPIVYSGSVISDPLAWSGTIVGGSAYAPLEYSGYITNGCGTVSSVPDTSYLVSDQPTGEANNDDDSSSSSTPKSYEDSNGAYGAPGVGEGMPDDDDDRGNFKRPIPGAGLGGSDSGLGSGLGEIGDGLGGSGSDAGNTGSEFGDEPLFGAPSGGDGDRGGLYRESNKPVPEPDATDRKAPMEDPEASRPVFRSQLGFLEQLDRDYELARLPGRTAKVARHRPKNKRGVLKWISIPNTKVLR